MNKFQGWTNYETFNVALYIQNEFELYKLAKQYKSYDELIPLLEAMRGQITPDGIRWMDPIINTDELDEMLADL